MSRLGDQRLGGTGGIDGADDELSSAGAATVDERSIARDVHLCIAER